jgi:branched-chain amino acid transport system ATP-binding protein
LGLAPKVTEALFDTISQIRREGVTIIMVEQNAYEAMNISDRCYVLQAGTIAMSGSSSEIMKDPPGQKGVPRRRIASK